MNANVVLVSQLYYIGYEINYFDTRKKIKAIDVQNQFGLICNVQSSKCLGMWKAGHWFAIRKVYSVLKKNYQSF